MAKQPRALLATTGFAAVLAGAAAAETTAPQGAWSDSIRFSGVIEAGATFNPTSPDTGINFGQLFTDKSNQLVLNRFSLKAERDPDPLIQGIDLGFSLEGAYGLDSQFTHFLGIGDQGSTGRNSFDLLQANIRAHAGLVTRGGIDVTAGFFLSPMGAERTDPTENFFYSNSYIYNFGLPRKHTGILTISHVSDVVDLYLGYTTGVNTSFGSGGGYDSGQPHVLGGVGLNFDSLTIKALTHIGAEDPPALLAPGVNPRARLRYINDLVIAWRLNPRLSALTEFNYVRDNGYGASAGGASEQFTYQLGPHLEAGLRAEVWRDAQGVFVAGYPGNLDYLDAEAGAANSRYRAGPATYGEITLGLNIKPAGLFEALAERFDSPFQDLTVRPEIRYDRALAGASAFGSRRGTARDQFTIGVDVVVPLSFQGRPDRRREEPFAGHADQADQAAHSQKSSPDDRKPAASPSGPDSIQRLPSTPAIDLGGGGAFEPAAQDFHKGMEAEDPDPNGPFGGEERAAAALFLDPVLETASPESWLSRPTRAWGADLGYALEQGYHANNETALLNLPVGGDAGLQLFASHQKRGGYLTNIYTGDPLYGRDERTQGEIQFDWNATPQLEVNLSVALFHRDGEGAPYSLGDTLAETLLGPSLAAAQPGLRFNAYGSPYLPGATVPLEPFQSANDYRDERRVTAQTYRLETTYRSPLGEIASTTEFLRRNGGDRLDLDGSCGASDLGRRPCPTLANPQVGFLHTSSTDRTDRFTEDARLSHGFGSWAEVTTGFLYARDHSSSARLAEANQAGVPVNAPLAQVAYDTLDERESVFVNFKVVPGSRLKVTGGLRFVDDANTYQANVDQLYGPFEGPGDVRLGSTVGSIRTRRLLAHIRLDYSLASFASFYVQRSTDFRPGGLSPGSALSEQIPGQTNYDPAHPLASVSAYRAETDTVYDLGSKIDGLDNQFSLRLLGYIKETRNYQDTQTILTPGYGPTVETYVVNLPKVSVAGVQFEVDLRPKILAGLTLSGLGSYQHARIIDGRIPGASAAANVNATAGPPGSTFDLTNTTLERSPAFTAAASADYALRLGPGTLDMKAGYHWTDRFSLATVAGRSDYQRAFGLADLSVSYSRSFYSLTVSVRNLTNQVHISSAIPALFVHSWGDPRTAEIALEVKF